MSQKDSDAGDVKPATVEKFRLFLTEEYNKELYKAAEEENPLVVDFERLDRRFNDLSQMLLEKPDHFMHVAEEAVNSIDLPAPVKIRLSNLPDTGVVSIRDLRSRHLGKFLSLEGIIRRASEVRPEIVAVDWKCLDCNLVTRHPVKGTFLSKPFRCVNVVDGKACDGKRLVEADKVKIDTRWVTMDEPFELAEGERPSQVNVMLTEDLVSPDGRMMTDPGNRLKIMGVLRDIPKGKMGSVKLDFYLEANHVEPTETSWTRLKISEEDEAEIKKLASDPDIYEKLIDSMAPSLFGLRDIKESIIMQLFSGVPRTLPDGTHFRGEIHILIIGDPAAGKSQLLKLVPEIVPRGRYVSGKGVTAAGLCMSYDTMVPLAHGEMRKIGDIVEDALGNGKKEIKEGWTSNKGNIEIVCLDKDLKIRKRKVSKFFKLKPSGRLVEFRTASGRKIKVTQENPLLTISDGDLVWRRADEIKNGEYIALARNIPVNHMPVDLQPEFAMFTGMIAGDGDIGNREIRFHNTSENYLEEFSRLSGFLGFKPRKYYQKKRIPCVRVASKDLCDRLEGMGIPRGVKCDKIVIPEDILRSDRLTSQFLSGLFTCDGGPVEKGSGSYIEFTTTSAILARQIQTALLRFEILSKLRERPPSKKGYGGKKKKYVIVIRGQENLKRFEKSIGFKHEKAEKLRAFLDRKLKSHTNVDLIPNLGGKIKEIRKGLGIKIKSEKFLYMLRSYEGGHRKFSRKQLLRFVRELKSKKDHPYFEFLQRLSQSGIFWDRVVEKGKTEEEWVYDLTVEGEHNFIANDIIVHNTATVTKDEQFMGGWVLEAGAMVLTNKGLLAIDEFEKMNPDDQVAMHEAMEQGSISIAKASIVATLPAKTSILAGGNPKFSRFDPMRSIHEQINIPPTLLSRFDLKFTLRDVPNAKADKKIVEHVLKSRHEAEKTTPIIPPAMIRKYVAYAKDKYQPMLSPEVSKLLKNFYVKTRGRAEGGRAPVPITLRQFEALMRISEASAKIQLSDVIRKSDADRAIKLMKASLKDLGSDVETGEIDVDKSEGGTPFSERSKISKILNIIDDLSGDKRDIVPIGKLRDAAAKEGIESTEVDDLIEKLKREGILFEPNPGYVQRP